VQCDTCVRKITQKIQPPVPHQVRLKQTIKAVISTPTTSALAATDLSAGKDIIVETILPTIRYKMRTQLGLKPVSASVTAIAKCNSHKQKGASLRDGANMFDDTADMYDDTAEMYVTADM